MVNLYEKRYGSSTGSKKYRTGTKSESSTYGQEATPPPTPSVVPTTPAAEKQQVIITLGKTPQGRRTIENIGGGLTPEQKREVGSAIIKATSQSKADQLAYAEALNDYNVAMAQAKAQKQARPAGEMQISGNLLRSAMPPSPPPFVSMAIKSGMPGQSIAPAQPSVRVPTPTQEQPRIVRAGADNTKRLTTWRYADGREITLPEGEEPPKFFSPFKSVAGQKERFVYAGKTVGASLANIFYPSGKYKITANINEPTLKRGVEFMAQNPIASAFVLQGGYLAATGGSLAAASAIGGKGIVAGAAKAATMLPTVAFSYAATDVASNRIILAYNKARSDSAQRGLEKYGGVSLDVKDVAWAAAVEKSKTNAERALQRRYEGYEQKDILGRTLTKAGGWVVGGAKAAARVIPGVQLAVVEDDDFTRAARKEIKRRGFTGQKADDILQAARVLRISESTSTAAAFGASSGIDEIIGRRMLPARFAKEAAKGTVIVKKGLFSAKLGKIVGSEIAPIGFVEGSVQEAGQRSSEGKNQNALSILAMGAFGTVSAGGISYVIGGLAPVPRGITAAGVTVPASLKARAPQKLVEWSAYLGDVFEKPGDVLANINEAAARNFAKATGIGYKGVPKSQLVFKVPVITNVPTMSFSTTLTDTISGKGGRKRGGGKGGVSEVTNVWFEQPSPPSKPAKTGVNVPAWVNIPSQANLPDKARRPKGGVPVSPFTDIDKFIEDIVPPVTPTKPTVPVPPDIPVSPNVNTESNIFVNTITPTSIFTYSNVPVLTPLIRFPPPLVLPQWGGLGSGGGLGRGVGRKVYANEVAAANAMLASFLGKGQGLKLPEKKLSKKERKLEKKHKVERKKAEDLFGIQLDLPEMLDTGMKRFNKPLKLTRKIL